MVVRSPQQTVVQQSSIQYSNLRYAGAPKKLSDDAAAA